MQGSDEELIDDKGEEILEEDLGAMRHYQQRRTTQDEMSEEQLQRYVNERFIEGARYETEAGDEQVGQINGPCST